MKFSNDRFKRLTASPSPLLWRVGKDIEESGEALGVGGCPGARVTYCADVAGAAGSDFAGSADDDDEPAGSVLCVAGWSAAGWSAAGVSVSSAGASST